MGLGLVIFYCGFGKLRLDGLLCVFVVLGFCWVGVVVFSFLSWWFLGLCVDGLM